MNLLDNKFVLARTIVQKKWPYLMSLIYGFVYVETTLVETACVTPGMVLGYNPGFVKELTENELAGCLAHECLHVLQDIFKRGEKVTDLELFNIAADLPINEQLRSSGWTLPGTALFPETFKFPNGLTTEKYYELLLKQSPSSASDDVDKNSKKKGNSKGKPKEKPRAEKTGVCQGNCSPRDKGTTESLEGNGRGRGSLDVKSLVKQTVLEAKVHAEKFGRGSLPGLFQEVISDLEIGSKIDWREQLTNLVRYASGLIVSGGTDFSLRQPSKRSHVRRILRPGTIDQEIVAIFIFDTSGSMRPDQLMAAVSESCAVLEQLGVTDAWMCQVDAHVALKPQVTSLDELRGLRTFHGRGGTDFRPGFEAALALTPRPDLVIYFTDGEGPAPEAPPEGIETVWCLIPYRGRTPEPPASWGHCVYVDQI